MKNAIGRCRAVRRMLPCVLVLGAPISPASASGRVTQEWLPGRCIPQFATALPVFGPGPNAALPRVNAGKHPALQIKMVETERQVLPPIPVTLECPDVVVQPTRIWAYETYDWISGKLLGPAFWPAVTIEARRSVPTFVKYVNNLPKFGDPITIGGEPTTATVQGLISTDQTLHWANPLGDTGAMSCEPPLSEACLQPFQGAPPAVVHMHGGEVLSDYDGGPEAWFTSEGGKGSAYRSLFPAGPGAAIYWYPNSQEPGTPWIHDHALGATRTNVYSGMAAFYFLRDPNREPRNLPEGAYEIEMAIQDRQFDTNSQLYFPDGTGDPASHLNGIPPNPGDHPYWIPEFAGDVVVVNGSPWPYLTVEPRRYRFRVVDGSNARFYNLSFGVPTWVIGADDGYLDVPVRVNNVFLAPGERADIIVDFAGKAGQSFTVSNDAPVPFPSGTPPTGDQARMAQIMRFDVTLPMKGKDSSCDPATGKQGGCVRPANARSVRLTDGSGNLQSGVSVQNIRQLTLKEAMGYDAEGQPTGPLEVLVNNTKWDGMHSPGIAAEFQSSDGISELPRVGSTEVWEIINLTTDAHPMHTHLAQFQILDRQAYDLGYLDAWAAAFEGKCTTGRDSMNPCPSYGPPNSYSTKNADGALGGNPAIGPYLVGSRMPPAPEESGWKDTAKAMPGEVLRIVVRWAPTYSPVSAARPGRNLYPFDPTSGPGYVWHCHIIDHEDNEMMRPYKVAR